MRKEIISCDYCGKQPALPVQVVVKRITDAAGSTEDEGVVVDLCHQHAVDALAESVNDGLSGRKFVDMWKGQ